VYQEHGSMWYIWKWCFIWKTNQLWAF